MDLKVFFMFLVMCFSFLYGKTVHSNLPEAIANGKTFTAVENFNVAEFIEGSNGYLSKMRVSSAEFSVGEVYALFENISRWIVKEILSPFSFCCV